MQVFYLNYLFERFKNNFFVNLPIVFFYNRCTSYIPQNVS